MNRNCKGSNIESNNRLRFFDTCKYHNISTTTPVSELHHKSCLDDLTVGLCSLVGVSQQLNKEESYGTNP